MKQMNRGLSNFGDLSNIESNIKNFDSVVNAIITDLKHSHEESLSALNDEIKAEETKQKQKDTFNKSNLNAIDMEIQKREKETKVFSNSLKAQMKTQQQTEAQVSKFENTFQKHQTKITNYDATIKKFSDGGWTSPEYLENVNKAKTLFETYRKQLKELKENPDLINDKGFLNKTNTTESGLKEVNSTIKNMSAAQKGFSLIAGQKELDKIRQILKDNSAMSAEAKAKIKAYYNEIESGNPSKALGVIHGKILEIVNAEAEAGRSGKRFLDVIKEKAWYGAASVIGTYFGVDDAINTVKKMASTVIDLNTQITELAKVSEVSSSQIYADFSSYANIAKEVRGTISDTISATADWSKNGYNLSDAKQLAEVSQLYKNVGDGIDINTANESLISTLRGFQLEADQAEHIVDVFNEVDILASYCSNAIALCVHAY